MLMEISETPDSKRPYYISKDGMERYFFNVIYNDGKSFSQYEQQENGRIVAHHWSEVWEHKVHKLEVWEAIRDDGVFTTVLVMEVTIPPNEVPLFKYRQYWKMPGGKEGRSCVFGYGNKLWEIDEKGFIKELP